LSIAAVETADYEFRVGYLCYHRYTALPNLGLIADHVDQAVIGEQFQGLVARIALKPRAVPEFYRQGEGGQPLPAPQKIAYIPGVADEKRGKLEQNRPQLARFFQGMERRGEAIDDVGELILVHRGTVVPGYHPVGLDIEDKVFRSFSSPAGKIASGLKRVEGAVDLHYREKLGIIF